MYIDLDILIGLSEKYDHIFKESVVNIKDTLMEIRKSTVNELDFILEANNIKRFRKLNQGSDYIYAPYMPITSTQFIMGENFQGTQGYATSYAKKLVSKDFYVNGQITHVTD